MAAFLRLLATGIASGGIYASLALALVMVYRATHVVNFAQGEMAMFSAYLALTLIHAGLPYWAAFALTVAVSFALGALLQRLLLAPLAGAPVLAGVGVSIGLLLTFNSLAGWIWGYTVRPFPSPFEGAPLLGGIVTRHDLGATAVTLGVLLLTWAFFRFTRLGLAMRAVACNPQSCRLMGIGVDRLLALGWGLAASLGAVAGMMVAPVVFLDPNMMSGVLLYAFAGALLGGIGSPAGAVAGGFAVGVIETFAGAYLVGNALKLTLALAIIVAVLTVRPAGLFGRTVISRV